MLDNWFSRNDVLPSGNSLLPANRSWSAWSSLTIIGQAGRERLVKRIIFFSVWFLQDLRTASHKNAKSDGFVGCGSRIGGGDLLLMLWANGWLRRTEKPPAVLTRMMMVAVVTFHQSYGEKVGAPPKRTPCQADAPNWDNFFRAPNEAWIEHTVAVRQAI